jgi:predicted anti-sigma-YlaC factor YlaD
MKGLFMRCEQAQRWISRDLDGILEESLKGRLAEHLAECGACREYAEGLATLGLDLLEVPEPTPDFTARVCRMLEQTPQRPRLLLIRPAVFRPIAAGLGVAAAVGGFAVGSLLHIANGIDIQPRDATVEIAAGDAIDPLAEDSVESVLIAMLSSGEE